MSRVKISAGMFAVIIIIALLFIDTRKVEKSGPDIMYSGKSNAFVDAVFTKAESTPDLTNITLGITGKEDAVDVRVAFFLPEGVDLVEGSLKWSGTVKKDEKKNVDLTVRYSGPEVLVEAVIDAVFGQQSSHSARGVKIGAVIEKKTPAATDSKGRPVRQYPGKQ